MKDIPFDVSVSCSRDNHDRFTIRVKDQDAVSAHFEITLTPKEFAFLISSAVVDAKATIRRPELFGKQRFVEDREMECPLSSCAGRETLRQWLVDNCQEDGWELDAYLGSQNSIGHADTGCVLRYRVMRWEDKT